MTTKLTSRLEALAARNGVASLYLFGSRAKEMAARLEGAEPPTTTERSDLDVAVEPQPGALTHASERVALITALEDLFDVPRVDLVILPEAGAFLAADAVRGELVYCDDEDRQSRQQLYYLRRAADLAPFQRQRLEGLLSGELKK